MLSLLYISRVAVAPALWETALIDIQTVSTARNGGLDITGLLVATPEWFAQLLEGPAENIDLVMISILADPRHRDVRIVRREAKTARRCPLWRLAKFEHGMFESTYVRPALACAHDGTESEPLRQLDRLIEHILMGGHEQQPKSAVTGRHG
ncbi:MAG: BLUF domain-containing protein [Sphingobium sp.]|nr:BLUF domain-containing protein [Sphingobium sp.]MCP5400097.1 BLUF domain-containing protein [Sphingomonas sp.]